MDQTFNGPVGQVSGRDINNLNRGPHEDLLEMTPDQLREEKKNLKSRIWKGMYHSYMNIPMLFSLIGMLALLGTLLMTLSNLLSGNIPERPPFIGLLVGLGIYMIPLYFMTKRRKAYLDMKAACSYRIEFIDARLAFLRTL